MQQVAAIVAAVPLLVSGDGLYDADDGGMYGFTCLGDQKAEIKFKNVDELVPDLSPVRVLQHAYGSGWAANYVAYMFLREKLGIETYFYPGIDHGNIYGPSGYYSYPGPGPEPYMPGYPGNYFFYLANDTGDVNFEFWQNMEQDGDGQDYYTEGSVTDGGFVGFYGEISYWLPSYFVEQEPTAIVPDVLANDARIRELLINGSRDGNTDWIAYFGANRGTVPDNNFTTSYDIPDGTKPIVWASRDGYGQTGYANSLNVNLGLDMHVVGTSAVDEFKLLELCKDLYMNRLPFVANIYVPDIIFGEIDPTTNETYQFEKVSFPRNPDQSPYDPCYQVDKNCQYPVQAVKKAANSRLAERFPEAYTWFQFYKMAPTEVTGVFTYYSLAFQNMPEGSTSHDHWLNASCEWLKNNEDVWTDWLVDIERWKCLPGCGIEHEGEYIGGTCDYATPRTDGSDDDQGTCTCTFEYLKGDACDTSCPGLSDPYMTDDGNYTFDVCSGHGTCNLDTLSCTCDEGYGGNGCQTKYDNYTYPIVAAVMVIIFSSFAIVAIIACIAWLRMNVQYKTVKALSIDMTTLFSVGLLFLSSSNIALVSKVNDVSCIFWQWLFGLGGILAILSPLLKAYRVSRVFHGGKMLRAVKITDKMLMQTLLKAALFEVLICIGYTVCHQVFGGTVKHYNDDELRVEYRCNDSDITTYVALGSYAYFFCLLCALTYYSYGTRRALSVFQESTCAYSSSGLAMFCSLITFGFFAATSEPTFRATVQAFAVLIVVTFVLGMFYGTRIWKFFKEPENRNVTDMRSPTYTASSTTGMAAPTGAQA